MAVPAAPAAVSGLVRTAAGLGRAGLAAIGGPLRDRAVGAAASNLKLSVAVLGTGFAFIAVIVALPVLTVVFALSVGVSHGLSISAPYALPPGPPLASPGWGAVGFFVACVAKTATWLAKNPPGAPGALPAAALLEAGTLGSQRGSHRSEAR